MGVIGSKEKLGQIAVIYGYSPNDFSWLQIDNRAIYQTSGLIITLNNKQYVLTTRSRLISCQNIIMYYCHFNDSEPIFRNNLQIIFQSIEYNIIILGTKGKNKLDFESSELISGDYIPKQKKIYQNILMYKHINLKIILLFRQ